MREALRYLNNAKEMLRSAPIEDDIYTDIKPIQEACSTAYLAVLKAIDEYLIQRGVSEKELPQSVDEYREMIRKYLSIRNGKLAREFETIYKALHIAGYYRGLLDNVDMVKDALKVAKAFIEKIK
jgi:DNA-binding FrmR family transcriptional regulator